MDAGRQQKAECSMKKDELINILKHLPEREPPPDLHGRIMQAVRREVPGGRRRLRDLFAEPLTIRFQPLHLALTGLACALFFVLGMLAGRTSLFQAVPADPLPTMVSDERANYFIGRGLLAAGEPEQAARYLSRAALLAPDATDYEFWQGVAYGLAGQEERERDTYRQLISVRPDYLPALINLGHNLLQNGDLDNALAMYDKVLQVAPHNREALYNRGLIFHLQGDRTAEATAWKTFLSSFRSGRWAFRALRHLNNLGDFSYRIAQIGPRRIIFNQAALLGDDEQARRQEVRLLADEIGRTPTGPLNLVLFRDGDAKLAKQQVLHLQALFHTMLPKERQRTISVSWFGQAESVHLPAGTQVELRNGLLLFSAPGISMNTNTLEEKI